MTDNTKYKIEDLIDAAIGEKPVQLKSYFDQLMADRIEALVSSKVPEVASSFNDEETETDDETGEEEYEEDEETDEDESDEDA